MLKKNKFLIIFSLLMLTSFLTVRLLVQQGEFKYIKAESDYQCQSLDAPYGSEDLFADYDTGQLYISASPRHLQDSFTQGGNIYILNMNDANPKIGVLLTDFDKKFRPIGISLITLENGTKRLFAINRPQAGTSTVEIFDIVDGKLQHIKSISGLSGSLNSITAINGEKFYATEDGTSRGFGAMLNGTFKLKYSEVIYYNGNKATIAADGFVFANGIEMSQDGTQVFVTDTVNRTLVTLDRDINTNALTKTGVIYIDAGGDNIRRNQDGSFSIAGHPKNLSSLLYIQGKKKTSPSIVYHATPPTNTKGGELRVVYLEDGSTLSGSSTAVRYNNKMFISSVIQNKILSCTK